MKAVAKVAVGVLGLAVLMAAIQDLSEGEASAPRPNEPAENANVVEYRVDQPEQPDLSILHRRAEMAKIENYAVTPYTPSEYPTTFRKFGSLVGEINQDRQQAAEIAATYTDCDFVQNAQISTSSPKTNRHYWVECGNLTRVYIDQESLAKAEAVDLQTKSDWIKAGLKDW